MFRYNCALRLAPNSYLLTLNSSPWRESAAPPDMLPDVAFTSYVPAVLRR